MAFVGLGKLSWRASAMSWRRGLFLLAQPALVACFSLRAAGGAEEMVHELLGVAHGAESAAPGPSVPMSPSMQCVISLTVQYFAMLLALQIVMTYNEFVKEEERTLLEEIFKNASRTTDFCPMLAILFIGVRMRAKELNPAGAPPAWAQMWMYICTYSILTQTLLEIITGYFGNRLRGGKLQKVIVIVQLVLLLGVYVGFTVVIASIFYMVAPSGNVNCPDCPPYTPGMATALACTVNLTTQFFAIYLAVQVVHQYQKVFRDGRRSNIEDVLEDTISTVKFCPILCVLFIGARMRALQLQTEPQPECKEAFLVCSYAVLIQTLMKLAMGFSTGAFFAERDDSTGTAFRGDEPGALAQVVALVQYVAMMAMYFGVLVVIYSVLTITAPAHTGAETPPVSPAMQCVMNLTVQFFAVYLFIEVLRTYRELVLYGEKNNLEKMLEHALPSLAMVPMLCVLFVGARLRALETDPVNGTPQRWAQLCMFACTWATLVVTVVSIFLPFFSGALRDPNDDDDEKDGWHDDSEFYAVIYRHVSKYLTITKGVALTTVYGGFSAIIASTFLIQAPPTGSR